MKTFYPDQYTKKCKSILAQINDEICACVWPEECIPEAYLSGANYNITIRHTACWSQLELGFNWTTLIGLLLLEVEVNMSAKFCCEVTKRDLKCKCERTVVEIFSPPQPDGYSVLLMICLAPYGLCYWLVWCPFTKTCVSQTTCRGSETRFNILVPRVKAVIC